MIKYGSALPPTADKLKSTPPPTYEVQDRLHQGLGLSCGMEL